MTLPDNSADLSNSTLTPPPVADVPLAPALAADAASVATSTDSALPDDNADIQQSNLGSGALATTGGVAAGEDGTAVGRDVQGDVINVGPGATQVKISIKDLHILRGESSKGKQDDSPHLQFITLSMHQWQRLQTVFVHPPDYSTWLTTILTSDERIFLITGERHVGKGAAALYLGGTLCQKAGDKPAFQVAPYVEREVRTLVSTFQASNLETSTVYLLRDAFERGLQPSDFSSAVLTTLRDALRVKKSFLILTTTLSTAKLEVLPLTPFPVKFEPNDPLLEKIFQKHLDWYRQSDEGRIPPEHLDFITQEKALQTGFVNPAQIDYFFDKLRQKEVEFTLRREFKDVDILSLSETDHQEKTRAALRQLAARARRFGLPNVEPEPTRLWFEKLPENARLYAMLAVLLEGLHYLMLEHIYEMAVQHLVSSGVKTLCDPRELGRANLLTDIRALVDENGQVMFDNPTYVREIRHQIHNRHLLLWSLVELLESIVAEHHGPESAPLRRTVGQALGSIGVNHKSQLEKVLDRLASDESGEVVAVAGYALGEMARLGPENYDFVLKVIERWAHSGDCDLMWAVGVAIWRIYDILARAQRDAPAFDQPKAETALKATQTILTYFAGHFDRFNEHQHREALMQVGAAKFIEGKALADVGLPLPMALKYQALLMVWAQDNLNAILHAIRNMLNAQADKVVSLVQAWLQAKESLLRLAGFLAAVQLFEDHASAQLTEEQLDPLLTLVGPILDTAEANAINVLTTALHNWHSQSDWSDKIQTALLPALNRASQASLEGLRANLIDLWLTSDQPEMVRLAHAYLTRSLVVAGQLLEPHRTAPHAILAIEASQSARNNQFPRRGQVLYGVPIATAQKTTLRKILTSAFWVFGGAAGLNGSIFHPC